jgi:hypothetical protein
VAVAVSVVLIDVGVLLVIRLALENLSRGTAGGPCRHEPASTEMHNGACHLEQAQGLYCKTVCALGRIQGAYREAWSEEKRMRMYMCVPRNVGTERKGRQRAIRRKQEMETFRTPSRIQKLHTGPCHLG